MKDHYRRQVQHLEALLARKLNEVSLLEEQHQVLQLKESALQSAIGALEGSLTCLTTTLDGGVPCPDATAAAKAAPAAAPAPAAAAHLEAHSPTPTSSPGAPAHSCSNSGASNGCGGSTGASSGLCARPPRGSCSGAAHLLSRDSSSLARRSSSALCSLSADAHNSSTAALQQLHDNEQRVQHVLQQLGGCTSGSCTQLYTTQLLQRALANEARTLYYLNHTRQQRLRNWAQIQTQMALLLQKYDANLSTSQGRARALLDDFVDDVCGRFVASLLYETPNPHLAVLMFNCETLEFEQYPAGWWDHVLQGVALSSDQTASLKLVWGRAKVRLEKLTRECDQLQAQLRQLQQQQLQGLKSFEQTLEQLPCLKRAQALAATSRRQRQQQLSPQQAEQQQQLSPQQGQQQQQQEHLFSAPPDCNTAIQLLHAAWKHEQACACAGGHAAREAVGAEAVADELIAELVTDLHFESQLGQQATHTNHNCNHLQQQQRQQQQQTTSQVHAAAAHTSALNNLFAAEVGPGLLGSNPSVGAAAAKGVAWLAAGAVPAASAAPAAAVPPVPCSPLFLPSVGGGQNPAAAAAAMAGQHGMPPSSTGAGGGAEQAASLHPGDVDAAGVLWQGATKERLQLERKLVACIDKIKAVYFSLMLHIVNTLTKKQIATMIVYAHPFVCDGLSFCEALDSLDV